ncbi:MAG: 50S ribosomal protein L17 [Bdellovibrionaceae bacterium]|nr:50S ribosomal protein L17 [Pseudobdellovibrionaceae bacterium]
MKHRKIKTSTFGLKYGPRKALLKGLVNHLVEKERIKTTLTKAKNIRPLVEKAVTLGRKNSLHAFRLLFSKYSNKKTVSKIINDLSKRFKDRPGGYTRIIKLGYRKGDQAQKALIEFIDYKFSPKPTKEEKEKYKASKEFQSYRRLQSKKKKRHKKTLNQIQLQSRRKNR